MRPKLIINSQLSIELKFSTFNFQFSIKEDGQENYLENHYPDAGHHPDRYWNYAGRHQLYDVALRCMRQHKH